MKKTLNANLPGIILFVFFASLSIVVYKDYGIGWDENMQRFFGMISYNYVFHHDQTLLHNPYRYYGVGFEVPLMYLEKWFNLHGVLAATRMRHLVSHLFFLVSVFIAYRLFLRLFHNQFIASLGFLMLVMMPRLYAHSYFNSKDLPFLSMFLISLSFCQLAFERKNIWLFVLLGACCGYTASIRIMGVLLIALVVLLLLIDIVHDIIIKKRPTRHFISIALFLLSASITLYAAWPLLWEAPVTNFIAAFKTMSHYNWSGSVLLNGRQEPANHLSWNYLPTWFLITTPVLWLLIGFGGIIYILIAFFKKPLLFLQNSPERNFILYLLCFALSVAAVYFFHSVLYDDWRHLYFIYPPFVLLGLYGMNKLPKGNIRLCVQAACLLQLSALGYFMVKNHPLQEVYFNELVSHDKEYLRKHYELDYWGPCFKQALEYLVKEHPGANIIVTCDTATTNPLKANRQMLAPNDRDRVILALNGQKANYFIAYFRSHPEDYPYKNIVYSVSVLNSTVCCIYKID